MEDKTRYHVIAIDGPAASGKSTVGRLLAEALEYQYLDTGSMYRAVTLAALQRGVATDDEEAVTRIAEEIDLVVKSAVGKTDSRMYTVLIDGEDVTWELRSPAVEANVSLVSSYLGVRAELVRQQRLFGEKGDVVMVGRDIGTVVMPDAPLKLYVTASAEERARRRWEERRKQGHENSFGSILEDVLRRDRIDSNRRYAPLLPADDAIVIDTTNRTPEDIVQEMLALVRGRGVYDASIPRN